jgi:hypothetical protein
MICRLIRDAGYTPAQRDNTYNGSSRPTNSRRPRHRRSPTGPPTAPLSSAFTTPDESPTELTVNGD